jgi:glutamate-1-semialdehyde 2,1-aminomutase
VQPLFDIEADLTTLGKIIGGGLPVAAYGGRAEIMNCVAPLGSVYQAGTLSGNPLAMRAGIETLKLISQPSIYERIASLAGRLAKGLKQAAADSKVPVQINGQGSLSTVFFGDQSVRNYRDAKRSDTKRYAKYFREMLDRGVFFAPSQFEAGFVSAAHTEEDIEHTIQAARESFQSIAAESNS